MDALAAPLGRLDSLAGQLAREDPSAEQLAELRHACAAALAVSRGQHVDPELHRRLWEAACKLWVRHQV